MRRRAVWIALALCVACRDPAPAQRPPSPPPPPPARPASLALRAHLGQPRATLEALEAATGTHRPVELMLAVGLGVDLAVLGAVDLARPVDLALLTGPSPGWVFALTPAGARHARSALASRYRFTAMDNVGERLEARGDPGLSDATRRLPCALSGQRVVCGSDERALREAARWIAAESVARAAARDDFEASVDGEGLREGLVPALRGLVTLARQRALSAASAARRARDRAPDYGDPEAAVALWADAVTEALGALATAEGLSLRAAVRPAEVELTAALALPASRDAPLSRDARARAALPGEHPLAAMLPADAVLLVGNRAPPASRQETLRALSAAALRVLGDRVPAPEAARADLDALFAHAGDAMAFAASRDAPEGVELSFALAQTDDGAGARAALARIAAAPWLRGVRVGVAPVVTAIRDGLVVSRAQAGAPVTAPGTSPAPRPTSLAVGLRGGALVAVLGRHAVATLDAATTRRALPVPTLLAGASASVAAGFDLAALGVDAPGAARVTYGVSEDGGLRVTLRAVAPTRALAALAALAE